MLDPLEARRLLAAVPAGETLHVANYHASGATTIWIVPSVSADADGNFVVVWADNNTPSFGANSVFGHRFSAAGEPLGNAFPLAATPDRTDRSAAVAVAPGGEFLAVWTAWVGSSTSAVGVRWFDNQAAPTAELLLGASQGGSTSPAVAAANSGGFAAAWLERSPSPITTAVRLQRFDASGQAIGTPVTVDENARLEQKIAVAMHASGDTVVTWRAGAGAWARIYDSDGVARTDPILVNDGVPIGVSTSVAIDDDGDFLVVWDEGYFAGDVHARRYNASGQPLSGPFIVNSYTTGRQRYPSVAATPAGDFVVVWDGDGPHGFGIHGRTLGREGIHNGDDFFVSPGFVPSVTIDAGGNFVVTWCLQSPAPKAVQAQRYTWDIERPEALSAHFHYATLPHSVRIEFSEDVSASLSAASLSVIDLGTNQPVDPGLITLAYDPDSDTATFAFDGGAGAGLLPEGTYRATLAAANVFDTSGNLLQADVNLDLSFLLGDANGDGRVDLDDFKILAGNFGRSPRDFTEGDFNYDGVVNLEDFNILAMRFGVVLGGVNSGSDAFSSRRIGLDDGDEEPLPI